MFFDDKYNDPRFERPEYMIVWGSNPLVSNPAGYFGHQIIDMMKMGHEAHRRRPPDHLDGLSR